MSNSHLPLQIEGLTKGFSQRNWMGRAKGIQALRGLDLALTPGEAFGLVGPNGAGKSTAIKAILGMAFPDQGRIRIQGHSPNSPLARQGMGFLPEDPALYSHLTAREIISTSAHVHGLSRHEGQQRASELLNHLGLSEAGNRYLSGFSKGMTQRAAIAHALAGEPSFLVLDEPLTGLDPVWRKRVVDLLMDFRDKGGTILFTSHILSDVERLADRIGILYQGELKEVTTPSDLIVRNLDRHLIRSHGSEDATAIGAQSGNGRGWSVEVESTAVWPTLRQLEALGHQIIEVRPAGAGLETALMRYLGETTD